MWGIPYESINWNAFFDDLCDFTWMDEGISKVVMINEGVPNFINSDVYFEVLIEALYRLETRLFRDIPDYGHPELFAKFNTTDWDSYLAMANDRTKAKVNYLLADENTRKFDKALF